jgi:hypothetical protein
MPLSPLVFNHRRIKMKRSNVFSVVMLILIIGVILTSCHQDVSFTPHCPYCNSKSFKDMGKIEYDGYKEIKRVQCKTCHKDFVIIRDP